MGSVKPTRVLGWMMMVCALALAIAGPAIAQEFRGRINGTVTDNSGAVLPGVTVTAVSPALIQAQATERAKMEVTGSSLYPPACTRSHSS